MHPVEMGMKIDSKKP